MLEKAVREQPEVLLEPPPLVIFEDFGDNSLVFDVSFWLQAAAEKDLRITRSNVRFRVDEFFNEHSIVISFPQRDVHLDGTLQLVEPR